MSALRGWVVAATVPVRKGPSRARDARQATGAGAVASWAMSHPLSQLSAEVVAMMAGGVSVLVSSRDEHMRASVMRAMGSSIDVAAGRVTVYVARSQAPTLLRDLEASGLVAVMFSQPTTHRTVQLKSGAISMRPATAADAPVLERYAQAMGRELEQVGYTASLARVMLAHRLEDLVAISFEPQEAFEQTPGPKAGARMAGGAA